jgi:hypothetical protein
MIEIVLTLVGIAAIVFVGSLCIGLIIGVFHGLLGAYQRYQWRKTEEQLKGKRPRR